jgi:hypothetical protein
MCLNKLFAIATTSAVMYRGYVLPLFPVLKPSQARTLFLYYHTLMLPKWS